MSNQYERLAGLPSSTAPGLRENYTHGMQSGGHSGHGGHHSCPLPAPPAAMCYCAPAPVSRVCGGDKDFRLTQAYGYAKPCRR